LITAVAGAVLLLRQRWRWLLVLTCWGFGVCDLCAHACLLPGRSSAAGNCLRSLAQPTTSEELIVIGFKSPVLYLYATSRDLHSTDERGRRRILKKWLQEKRPYSRAYTWSTEKLDNLGLQPPQYKDLASPCLPADSSVLSRIENWEEFLLAALTWADS